MNVNLEVIHEILADAGQGLYDLDAMRAELVRRSNAGKHEELRRADGSCRQHNFPARLGLFNPSSMAVSDPHGSTTFKLYALDHRPRADGQIAPRQHGGQIGACRAAAHTIVYGHFEIAEPLLPKAVEVIADRMSRLPAGIEKSRVQRVAPTTAGDGEWTIPAAVRVVHRSAQCPFDLLEIRQHVSITPTCRAVGVPSLEVTRVAADINHAVDRRRTTQHFTARAIQPPTLERGLRFTRERPVKTGIVHRQRKCRRHANEGMTITAARLQQQHLRGTIFAKSIREHAACRTRANDDVVEALRRRTPNFTHATCFVNASAIARQTPQTKAPAIQPQLPAGR